MTSKMKPKPVRTCLTLKQRHALLVEEAAGQSSAVLMAKYDIKRSAFYTILSKRQAINEEFNNGTSALEKKRPRRGCHTDVDRLLLEW